MPGGSWKDSSRNAVIKGDILDSSWQDVNVCPALEGVLLLMLIYYTVVDMK